MKSALSKSCHCNAYSCVKVSKQSTFVGEKQLQVFIYFTSVCSSSALAIFCGIYNCKSYNIFILSSVIKLLNQMDK